jgi:hypothetical protein
MLSLWRYVFVLLVSSYHSFEGSNFLLPLRSTQKFLYNDVTTSYTRQHSNTIQRKTIKFFAADLVMNCYLCSICLETKTHSAVHNSVCCWLIVCAHISFQSVYQSDLLYVVYDSTLGQGLLPLAVFPDIHFYSISLSITIHHLGRGIARYTGSTILNASLLKTEAEPASETSCFKVF